MFPAIATVLRVEKDDVNRRFYAKAELILREDIDHAELQLPDIVHSVYGMVLVNAKAGRNTFNISGKGDSRFTVGDSIIVICFSKGEMPPLS